MKNETSKQLLFDKRAYYMKVTRNIRWFAIALVVVTLPLNILLTPVLIALLMSGVVYNFLWYAPKFRRHNLLGSFVSMNVVDNGFVLVLVLMTGGISSPYYVFFTFMAVTATYWYGYRGLVTLSAFHILAAISLHFFYEAFSLGTLRVVTVLLFTFIINGILAQRLTHGDRQERIMAERANEEKETEKQRLLSLINSIGDAVIAVRDNGKVLMHNGAALELLDTNMRLMDASIDKILKVTNEEGEPVELMDMLKSSKGISRRRDLSFEAADKTDIKLDITISPITDTGKRHGLSGGYIFILRDITKEKSLDETRDEFISVTSHELRTPIAIAEASLSTALMPEFAPDNDKTKEMIKKAHDNVTFLGALVQDLSTLALAEHGVLNVDLARADPNELVRMVISDHKEDAKRKGLVLKSNTSPEVKPILTSVPHIKEILQNFITNALKYTEKGSIFVGVKPDKNSKAVIFYVTDTGIGISTTDKKHIFDKFYRSEDYRTRQTGGTGLGLYVTKKLAERLDGDVWFESKFNKGSTFYLKVPPVTMQKKDRQQVLHTQMDDFVSSL